MAEIDGSLISRMNFNDYGSYVCIYYDGEPRNAGFCFRKDLVAKIEYRQENTFDTYRLYDLDIHFKDDTSISFSDLISVEDVNELISALLSG